MSWIKRRGHLTPSPAAAPAPPVQMYDPNQHTSQSVSVSHVATTGMLLPFIAVVLSWSKFFVLHLGE